MKLLLDKFFLDTSMNLFILNESRGGYKSSFGLCVGLIDRQGPNMCKAARCLSSLLQVGI